MALTHNIPTIFLFVVFCFFSFSLRIHSLSTVSVSVTLKQTLVCAIVVLPSSINQQPFLNCTSFPSGIRLLLTSHNGSYSRIVGGNGFLCAVRSQPNTSVMDCWRFSADKSNVQPKRVYRGAVLSEIEAGFSHVCGVVNGTSKLKCWQWKEWDSHSVTHSFSSISVGGNFVCGLDSKHGNISCLGEDADIIRSVPKGNYSVIGAGSRHACAISLDGSLQCWGSMVGSKPKGDFMDLALGDNRSCAMRINGTVVCWGGGGFRVPTSLEETYFTGIVAKESVFCGVVTSNFSLLCWGNEILDGNMLIFDSVMPGPCTSECPMCGPLAGYGKFCGQGLMVCKPCAQSLRQGAAPEPSSLPPSASLQPLKGHSSWTAKLIVLLVVGCLGSVSLLAIIVFLVCRYRGGKGCRVHDSGPLEQGTNAQGVGTQVPGQELEDQPVAPPRLEKRLSHMYSMGNGGHLEEFPLEVLLKVTKNFSQECRIGIGSFGSVYHAVLEDGREVAIKRAEASTSTSVGIMGTKRRQEDKDVAFMAELEFLSRLNHKHLVRLLGFYEDASERVLVYEFMNNSTLHDHLHKLKNASPLASWPARIKVALDAARGIDYLHAYAVPPIIHRDIKPSNILLDDNWTAKVSDFGLSLMGPQEGETHLSLWAAGTFGYVDPEYYRLHQLTTKSDVYSFGVILLEILSGYKAIHTIEDGTHRNVVDFLTPYIMRSEIHRILDPNVPPPTPVEIEAVMLVGELAVACVSPEGRHRPSMSEVVSYLERALADCLAQPTLSSSSTTSSR